MKQKSRVSTFLIFSLFLLGALSMCTRDLYSEPQSRKGNWYNLGLGSGDIHGFKRIAFSVSLTHRRVATTYSFRFLAMMRPFSEAMYDNAWELGVLYGRILTPPSSPILVSGGIGLGVGGVRVKYDNVTIIGAPIEVQLLYKPNSPIGIGLYGFANINTQQIFYGVTFCLSFGRS